MLSCYFYRYTRNELQQAYSRSSWRPRYCCYYYIDMAYPTILIRD